MSKPLPRQHADTHEREFISAARLLMICGLVFHHLFEIPGSTHSPRLNMAGTVHFVPELVNTFVHLAFMTAVPVLSIISGFLFFCRPVLDYRALFGSRLRSVALPTWIWSAFWLALAFALFALAGNTGWFPWTNYGFDDPGAMTVVNGVFGVTREPFAFQFWFVHDLLLTILLAPVLYFFLSRLGWYLLVLMAVFWVLVPWPPVFFSGNVLMFFAIGAWLTLPQSPGMSPLLLRLQGQRWLWAALFALALLARIFSHRAGTLDAVLQGHEYLCLLRVLGVLAFAAHLSAWISRYPGNALVRRYSGYAFFIFAVHYPLIELLQAPVALLPGHASAIGLSLSWLLIPALTIVVSVWSARLLETRLPALFRLLNGGRGTHVFATAAPQAAPDTLRCGQRAPDLSDPWPDTR
jgi:hypothetical protein